MQKIIGAGIAGLSAAIILAKGGERASVFEKNRAIGLNTGENIQAIRNYGPDYGQLQKFRKEGLDLNYTKPIYKITKYSPSGRKMEINSKEPLFYIFRRGEALTSFDSQLFEQAEDEGVKFQFKENKNLKNAEIVSSSSIFRNIAYYGVHFKDVTVQKDTILFFLNNEFAPHGYLGLIPYGKHEASIGEVSFNLNANLPLLFERFLKENMIISKIIENSSSADKFGGFTYANVPKTAEINKIKFIGSAAGFVDAARGFGVNYCLESAIAAAQSIINKTNYDTIWKGAIESELLAALKRRIIYEHMADEDFEKLIFSDKIDVSEYNKIPITLDQLVSKLKIRLEIDNWRKKYSLKKLFY
ncbi:MAG: NAD(P)/FAD-dependent oxidoreductase [Candidatus Diapherotrites archaeon]